MTPFGAVILAAGASKRMGRPKMLLPWGSTSILGHIISNWHALGASQVAVVCAPDNRAIREELDRLAFPIHTRILNPAPEQGMFSSIRVAAQWTGWEDGLSRWAIVLGDQPQLGIQTLTRVLRFAEATNAPICQPSYRQRPRHPVLLAKSLFQELGSSTAPTLKEFLQSSGHTTTLCEIDDPALDIDLDTPSEYEAALARYGESVSL